MMSRVLGEPKGRGAPFGERKLEVLKAAARLFNERGFHNTTMDDIAATLRVTKPALYYYAKSKDEILFQIGDIALSEATRILENISSQNISGAIKLKRFFVEWSISICHEFGRCLILTKPESLEPKSRKKSKANRRKIHRQVVSLIKSGFEDGSVALCDPELVTLALFDLFNGITYWYKPKGKLTPTDIAEKYWQIFIQGLHPGDAHKY